MTLNFAFDCLSGIIINTSTNKLEMKILLVFFATYISPIIAANLFCHFFDMITKSKL